MGIKTIEEAVDVIVKEAQPEKVLPFGSAAWGEGEKITKDY